MLERFAVSIAASTILAVLAKLAVLYYASQSIGHDWVDESLSQLELVYLLLAIFLVFLRGKMMHDDATFFADLAKKDASRVFKTDRVSTGLLRLGLLLGYMSWLLWAPAIYFLDRLTRFTAFFVASLALSSAWLVIDILTREKVEWRRAFWIIPNLLYAAFAFLLTTQEWRAMAAFALLMVLLVDWLVSDPLVGHL